MSAISVRTIAMLAIGAGLGFVAATISCQPASTAEAGSASVTALPATEIATAGQQGGRARLMNPTGEVSDPYSYFPDTEELGPDEIRVVACGTGMPAARRGQAASCFLVELGNGDKFLFDIGSGSMRNVQSLNIPADFLRKIFLSHLHTDHWGDLNTLWAGGWTGGRTGPLEVWGPPQPKRR